MPNISRVLFLGVAVKGEVAGVGQQLLGLHQPVDLVLGCLVLFLGAGLSQRHRHRSRCPTALARMGLVDDHGELASPVLVADCVEDERELLDRGDDDPLSLLEQSAEVAGVLGMAHDGADLGELFDGVPYLLVQQPPVGDDEDGVKDDLIVPFQPCQLVGQPGD